MILLTLNFKAFQSFFQAFDAISLKTSLKIFT